MLTLRVRARKTSGPRSRAGLPSPRFRHASDPSGRPRCAPGDSRFPVYPLGLTAKGSWTMIALWRPCMASCTIFSSCMTLRRRTSAGESEASSEPAPSTAAHSTFTSSMAPSAVLYSHHLARQPAKLTPILNLTNPHLSTAQQTQHRFIR